MEALAKKTRRKSAIYPQFFKTAILQGVYFLLSLVLSLGGTFGDLMPFGTSITAAVPLKFTGVTVAGASLGYIFANPRESFRYIGVLLSIGALKWLLSDLKKISKHPLFAPLLSFVPMMATGLVLLFVSGSKLTDLSMVIIESTLSAVGAFFLSKTLELSKSTRPLSGFTSGESTCLMITVSIVIFSFGPVEIFSFSLGRILAIIGILLLAKFGGVAFGSIGGIVTGVLFSLSSRDLSFLPGSFALGGLIGGLCAPYGKLSVGVAFVLCSSVMAFASEEESLVMSIFIEALLSVGIFMLIPDKAEKTAKAYFIPQGRKNTEDYLQRGIVARLKHTAGAVEGVAKCVTDVSKKLSKVYGDEEDHIYNAVLSKACKTCGLKSYCLNNQKETTTRDFQKVVELMKHKGTVDDKDIEEIFSKKCHKTRELTLGFNLGYRDYLSALSAKSRMSHLRGAVAGQFSGLSMMLSDLSEEFETIEYLDGEASEEIINELHQMGIVATSCCAKILGGNRMVVELTLAESKSISQDERQLREAVEKVTGRLFEIGNLTREGGSYRLSLMEETPYDVEIGSSQHIADNGKLCGDTLDYFLTGEGSLLAVISDGMGTGGSAAVDSNMAVSILTKLIKAGLSPDSALSVVNSALMIKSEDESAATLDLVEANLFTGKVTLNKAGAPMTLIKRGGRVHRREYPSLPVGILNKVNFIKESITLREDDRILMISDGAIVGDEKWLEDMVRSWRDTPSDDFASQVVQEAIKRRNDGHDDDITAIAMKLVTNS